MFNVSAVGLLVTSVKEFAGKNSSKVLSIQVEKNKLVKEQVIKNKFTLKVFGSLANTKVKEGDIISFTGGDISSENNNGTWFTYISLAGFSCELHVNSKPNEVSKQENHLLVFAPIHQKEHADGYDFEDEIPF